MEYSAVTRTATISIDGKEYSLRFTLAGLEKLESRMQGTSLFDMMQAHPVPTLSTLVDTVWIGLDGAGSKMTREGAENLALSFMRESGMEAMVELFYTLIALSGIMGPAVSKQLLASFHGDAVEAEKPGKNGGPAKGRP